MSPTVPFPVEAMAVRTVGKAVGNVKNEGPQGQGRLVLPHGLVLGGEVEQALATLGCFSPTRERRMDCASLARGRAFDDWPRCHRRTTSPFSALALPQRP